MTTALEMIGPVLLTYNTEGKIRVGDICDVMKEYANQVAKDTLNRALLSINYDEVPTKYIEIIRSTQIQLP